MPEAESWRDSVSQAAQAEMDALFSPCLDLASDFLSKRKSFSPFAVVTNTAGDQSIVMLPMVDGVDSLASVQAYVDDLRRERDNLNACAIVFDVRLPSRGSDAVEIRLEHREGASITIDIPYKLARRYQSPVLGQMFVANSMRRIWTDVAI